MPQGFASSSKLISNKVSSYETENIHDFDLRTAWVEGDTNYGIGEKIEIDFNFGKVGILRLTELIIYNGYSKSLSLWKAN